MVSHRSLGIVTVWVREQREQREQRERCMVSHISLRRIVTVCLREHTQRVMYGGIRDDTPYGMSENLGRTRSESFPQ